MSQIQLNLIEPDDVKVLTSSNFTGGIEVGVGQKVWVPFFVQLPPQTITPVQVSFFNSLRFDIVNANMRTLGRDSGNDMSLNEK